MGTLTANSPCLDEHCQHKLPSSCRLTATTECCACQDKRAHAPTYSTYVDGVGMVSRGTRWQRYCWFCKEFWENRVHLEGVDPKVTKIPEVPDQTDYCSLWFDYHRGYRITESDGQPPLTEPVERELPWDDTAPGYLPLFQQPESSTVLHPPPPQESSAPHVTIEQALDDMLSDADDESPPAHHPPPSGREQRSQHQTPRELRIALRNQLPSDDQLRDARLRLEEAEARHRQLRSEMSDAQTELRACRERQRQLTNARNTSRNLERVFGTREEFLQQGANYVSPVSAMFTRAQGWYQVAEEVRRAERESNHNEEQHEQMLASLGHQDFMAQMLAYRARQRVGQEASTDQRPQSLDDERIQRPPPKTEEQMNVSLACKICLQQVSDTAVFPCGHLIMCGYCASIAMPTKDEAGTIPASRSANCPMCRKSVKRVAKIYLA